MVSRNTKSTIRSEMKKTGRKYTEILREIESFVSSDRYSLSIGDLPKDFEVNEKTFTHVLIAGSAGSGKTYLMQDLVRQVHQQGMKYVGFSPEYRLSEWSDFEHFSSPTEEKCLDILKILKSRMYGEDCSVPFMVFVDDFDVLGYESEIVKDLINLLCVKGRAFNIHCVVSAQRPASDIVMPSSRANMTLRIATSLIDVTFRNLIFGEPEISSYQCPLFIGRSDDLSKIVVFDQTESGLAVIPAKMR